MDLAQNMQGYAKHAYLLCGFARMTQLPHSLRVLRVLLSHEPHGRRRSRAPRLLTAALVALLAALLLSLGPPPEAAPASKRRRPASPAAGARELLGPFDGWTHARALTGEQWLRVYTRISGHELGVRVHGFAFADAATLLSVLREVDLMPRWNRFCDRAELLHATSPTDITAVAGTKLPWPVPPQSLRVRAQVARDDERAGVVALAWPPEPFELPRSARQLPAALRERHVLPLGWAVGRLRTEGSGSGSAHDGTGAPAVGTSIEAAIIFDLSASPFASAAASVPGWLVKLIVFVCVPAIWNSALAAAGSGGASGGSADAAGHGGSRHPLLAYTRQRRERVLADRTGLYARVARWMGQARHGEIRESREPSEP